MERKQTKTAVLFDVDDTLYDQTAPFFEAYKSYFGKNPQIPAEKIYPVTRKYSDEVYSRAMAGEITMEDLYIYRGVKAFEEFGIRITEETAMEFQKVYADRQSHIHLSPLMEEILEFCSVRAKAGIITNGPSGHQWNKIRSLGVERWIPAEYIFVSGDVGYEKPDRRIFETAARNMGADVQEFWFVGDSYPLDMEGAMNAGWNTIWLNRRNRKMPEGGRIPSYCAESEKDLGEILEKILNGTYQY